MKRSKLLVSSLLIFGVAVAVFLYWKYRVPPTLAIQKLELTDLQGHAVSLPSYQGKNMVVVFFATWCGPCMKEIPLLQQAEINLQDSSNLFVLISDEPLARLQLFKARSGTTLQVLHSFLPLKEIGIVTYPTSYILNKQLQVVFNEVGFVDWTSPESTSNLKNLGR